MKVIQFLLMFFMISQVIPLSTSFTHLNTEEDKQNYLNALLAMQADLARDNEKLKNLVGSINSKVNQNRGYDTIQGEILQSGLKEEGSLIYDMQNSLILPVEKKTWECTNITKEQANSIDSQIGETQNKISELENKMKNQVECQRNDAINSQLQYLKMYLNHLVREMGNVCEEVPVSILYVPPADAQFVYGNMSKQQYEENVQKKRNQGFITQQCPPQKPYPSNGECVGCNKDQVYDLSSDKCTYCEGGYEYDSVSHTCILEAFNNNPTGQNYYGQVPSNNPQARSCPSSEPYFNGEKCIECQLPRFFNFNEKSCQYCQDGLVFDLKIKNCGYKKFNSNLGPVINYCCKGEEPEKDPSYETCPHQKPFFNGKECISCALPSFFSLSDSRCQFCTSGEGFSLKDNKCIDQKLLQPVYQSDIDDDTQNYMGTPHRIPPGYENVHNCPEDKPFYDEDECVACELPHYFNFNSNNCEVCNPGSEFDVNEHKCKFIATGDQYNNNMVDLKNYQGKIPQYDSSLPTCPSLHPFFNGQSCIECQLPKYANLDTRVCQQCPRNRQFNLFNRECQAKYHSFYTDVNADNIFYNGDFNDVKRQIQKNKQNNPSISVCGDKAPFFNALEDKCIKCPHEFPLFDFKYNRCMKCTGKSQFDNDKHICITNGSVSPTIERMIMNTIGFI